MKFEYNVYFKVLVIASVFIMTFSIIGILINIILLIKNNGFIKFDKRIMNYFISIIIFVFLFSIGFGPFKHGIHLITEKETDKISVIGEVDCIKKTYGINKYSYNNDVNSFAHHISIDGEVYYIMYIGDIKIGDKVEVEYLPKSKVILSINEKWWIVYKSSFDSITK